MENRNYSGYFPSGGNPDDALAMRVSSIMKRVYAKMFLGLLVTAVVAWLCVSSTAFVTYYMTHSWTMWVVMFAELGLVIWITAGINRMSNSAANALFYLFAVINAVMLTPIFLVYTHISIAKTFFITAAVFGAMSVYGYFTRTDLTSIGKFLTFALFGLVIACLINIFWANSTMEWVISIVGVLVFIGLTAWDTQQVKRMAQSMPQSSIPRLATLGALNLYLDFINMFIFLLNIFGGNND